MGKGRILVPIFPVKRKQTNLLLRQNLFDLTSFCARLLHLYNFLSVSEEMLAKKGL